MSFLGKVFGSGKKTQDRAPTPQEAIGKLRDLEEILNKKQEFLEGKVEAEVAIARKHGTKNKKAALQALKRKKRYEKQLGQIDGTLTTIEYQLSALENSTTNVEVLKIMGLATKALQRVHGTMDADMVHNMMDDIQEQQEVANEISEAISTPIAFQDVDEDELAKELEELEQEALNEELVNVAGPEAEELPIPPSAVPVSQRKAKEQEDESFKSLAQWAS